MYRFLSPRLQSFAGVVRIGDSGLIHVEDITRIPSLQLRLHHGDEVLGISLSFMVVLLGHMRGGTLREPHGLCEAMDAQFLGLLGFYTEAGKKTTCLPTNHPVGHLNTLVAHYEDEMLQLSSNLC